MAECICILLALKPIEGSFTSNIIQWGCGALNIDGCRIFIDPVIDSSQLRTMNRGKRDNDTSGQVWEMSKKAGDVPEVLNFKGRWPANLMLQNNDEIIREFPEAKGWSSQHHNSFNPYGGNALNKSATQREGKYEGFNDEGSAARFFKIFGGNKK